LLVYFAVEAHRVPVLWSGKWSDLICAVTTGYKGLPRLGVHHNGDVFTRGAFACDCSADPVAISTWQTVYIKEDAPSSFVLLLITDEHAAGDWGSSLVL
jgi:hypothetical protein